MLGLGFSDILYSEDHVRVLSLVGFLLVVQVCRADLIGTTVTGTFEAVGFPFNYWDPGIGFVPATGFQNSPSNQDSPTLTIVGGNEFGETEVVGLSYGTDLSFRSTGFTLTENVSPQFVAVGPYQITLTDTAFQSVNLVSNNFPSLTYGISNEVITINLPLTNVPPYGYSASFDVNTPEPSGVVWIVLGGFAVALRRRSLARKDRSTSLSTRKINSTRTSIATRSWHGVSSGQRVRGRLGTNRHKGVDPEPETRL